ncbi:hypothetical protein GE09DRAFT_1042819 [Coniochaeta sp. 2T2.1]|nr:hypothetical protein GE09DRAFT_1042819 [Coniochaeta sp. 2T2.1]
MGNAEGGRASVSHNGLDVPSATATTEKQPADPPAASRDVSAAKTTATASPGIKRSVENAGHDKDKETLWVSAHQAWRVGSITDAEVVSHADNNDLAQLIPLNSDDEGIRHKCDICEKRLSTRGSLTRHKRIHTEEKPCGCNICGERFSRRSHLTRHRRIHTRKPFECDICKKRLSDASDLKKHKRIHTEERPFECDICKKRLSTRSSLATHKRIHTEKKPFGCNICGKRFYRGFHLTTHRRIHTGEKPFECDICKMRVSDPSNLTSHKRIHTGEKPFECEISKGAISQGNKPQRGTTTTTSLNRALRMTTQIGWKMTMTWGNWTPSVPEPETFVPQL